MSFRTLSLSSSFPRQQLSTYTGVGMGVHAVPLVRAQRSFHASVGVESQRKVTFQQLRRKLGPKFETTKVSVPQLIETFRVLKAERALQNHPDKSAFYRDAEKDLSLAFLPSTPSTTHITIPHLATVLSDDNAVAWRAVTHLVEKGFVPEVEGMDDRLRRMILFHSVHGIGPKKAEALVEAGYETLEQLNDPMAGLLRAQKIGLKYHSDMSQKIPRAEIDQFKGIFRKAIDTVDPEIEFEICGSYRRGQATSSDIDLVAWHKSYTDRSDEQASERFMELIWVALRNAGVVNEDICFSRGKKKIMTLIKLPNEPKALYRQLDIRSSTLDSLPYTMLGLTGDDSLMKILRKEAKDGFGMTLNEYEMGTLKDDKKSTAAEPGTEIMVEDEEGIFKKLGFPYLKPEERNYRVYSKLLERRFF